MALAPTQMSFAGGEVSPLIVHRFEQEQYALGARTLHNFLVLADGVLTRRPGTHHADDGSTKNNALAYLVPWVYEDADAYVLEFTPLKIRVYRDHALVESAPDVPLEITTVYTADELPYVQIWQSGDVMWIRCETRWTYKLTRASHTSWTMTAVYPNDGPWRSMNTTDITLACSGIGKPATPCVITASEALFDEDHENSAWRLDHTMPERSQVKTFTSEANDTQALLIAKGAEWEFIVQVAGDADADIELQYSLDGSAWTRYRSLQIKHAAADPTIWETLGGIYTGRDERTADTPLDRGINEEDRAIYLRAGCTTYASGTIATTIKAAPYVHSGIVWLSQYNSATSMSGFIVVSPASTDATLYWAESAVNGVRGYWRALGFNAERLLLASTEDEPLRIDAGAAGDYDSFDPGFADDADAFSVTLSQSRQNRINWINGEWTTSLIVGTEGGIVELQPLNGSGGFTPTNYPAIHRTLRRRTSRILPLMVDDVLVFVGGVNGQRLYQAFHSTERGGLVAEDLTRWARHVGASGFTGLAVQQDPQQILWAPRADGVLVGCSFAYGATAFHRHFSGEVVSHCTVPTSDGDELWLCMKRTVDGSDYYFVEYLHQVDLEAEIEDAYFVDCGESWNGGTAAAVASVTVANPCVVTLTTWPEDSGGNDLADGNYVRFTGVTDLADQIFQVYSSDATAKTLQLKDVTGTTIINGTLFESYLSGGTMAWVTDTVSGMDHLAGETLLALGDGVQLDVSADESGDVALGQWCHTVHCGLAQTGTVVSLPLEFYLKTGLTVGANKQLTALTVSLYRSYGGQYGVAADKYKDIPYRRAASETETGPFLYTGQKNLPSAGGVFDGELNVMIQCTGAYPFTIRGLAPKIAVNE